MEILCEVTSTGPVCGTDDVTYGNECNLRVTAAMLNLDIDVQYKGRCKPVVVRTPQAPDTVGTNTSDDDSDVDEANDAVNFTT